MDADRQSHRAAAIGHGEMAIGDQGPARRRGVPTSSMKRSGCVFKPRLPGDDLLARRDDGLPAGTTREPFCRISYSAPEIIVHVLKYSACRSRNSRR